MTIKDNLREAYNKKAEVRDAKTMQDWKMKERDLFLSLLLHEGKESLLEIGAGTGKDSTYFQEAGLEVVCIDLSPENIKLCRDKGLNARVMDFCELQFPENSFDAVYALNCLLHIPKNEFPTVLAAIDTILKPGGLFYIGMYGGINSEGVWEKDTYEPKRFFAFYDAHRMKQIVGQVFEVVSFKGIDIGHLDDGLYFQSMVLRQGKESRVG